MVSNLPKRWQDDFSTVKRQRNGFRALQKEMECHWTPAARTYFKWSSKCKGKIICINMPLSRINLYVPFVIN
jgi:hypothetical protein